ncbi:FtsH protease activity modulator HflK [Legionella impletisoli]|uniref:Protein HflK n=1 Tax=Legionella impletisoli TaxID=343510 RepID=A0A917JU75_9GAMM|nr:FtsH protease activity modulator HflK [Legionella impletisoli]GGI86290.1 protease modulator HflK [Legionella impletisoli]
MGWNEPDKDKDKDKDPWSGKDQPPDLDEALKRLQERLKRTFMKGSQKSDSGRPDSGAGGAGILAAIIFLAAFILWALSGIFIVDPAEQAAILRFGKYVETVGPGPHWIPRLISSKIVVNVERVSDYSYSANMLTKDENLVSVSVVVQYRIGDLEEFLFNVADPIESLQQATSSALRQVIGHTSLDEIITEGRDVWGSKVQESLIQILARYKTGILVVNVSPQPARAPESVQDAFDDAIKAQEDEKRFIEQARAYEARVVPIAHGNAKRILAESQAYAQQVVLNAKGETAEFLKLLPVYLQSPYVTAERMYLDAMQKVLSQSSKIIVDGKSGNLLYLPLEKLINQTNSTKSSVIPKADLDEGIATQAAGESMYDGRPLLRPTERPGRIS